MISFEETKPGVEGVLTLSGEMTLECAEEIKESMLKALSSVGHVTCDVKDVTEADLSFLQMLCSAHKTSLSRRKMFTLSEARSEQYEDAVQTAGLVLSCSVGEADTCLWLLKKGGSKMENIAEGAANG